MGTPHPQLAEVLHGVPIIERTTVNAWDDRRVVDAVKATGRKKLIVTGISTDVCLAFPAIAALADGFQSYAVIDASGGLSQTQGIGAFSGSVNSLRSSRMVDMMPPSPLRSQLR